jgi:Holliday junction DNA helicase RuvA
MIATLSGVVSEQVRGQVVLDVHGVGYGLQVTTEDMGRLSSGQNTKLYVYEHIREQAHDLYGFVSLDTKQLFEQLLDVNGVGPKMALNILSIGNGSEVRTAIAGGDTKFISQAQGVGKRVAERVVVELKDKVGLEGVDLTTTGMLQGENLLLKDEAVEALVALGYTPQDAAKALVNVDPLLPTEQRITLALKQ